MKHDACNSFFRRPNGRPYFRADGYIIGKTQIRTTTIDEFCKENNISKIDILKMDIQGAELLALKGAITKLKNHLISLIYSETIFSLSYDKGALYHEIADFLAKYGYTLYNIYNQNYNQKYASNGQIMSCDSIFLSPQLRRKIDKK